MPDESAQDEDSRGAAEDDLEKKSARRWFYVRRGGRPRRGNG